MRLFGQFGNVASVFLSQASGSMPFAFAMANRVCIAAARFPARASVTNHAGSGSATAHRHWRKSKPIWRLSRGRSKRWCADPCLLHQKLNGVSVQKIRLRHKSGVYGPHTLVALEVECKTPDKDYQAFCKYRYAQQVMLSGNTDSVIRTDSWCCLYQMLSELLRR